MLNYREFEENQLDYHQIIEFEEVANGERIFLEIGDQEIVLFRIGDILFAIQDICSHDNGPLGDGDIEGDKIVCPRHGSRFSLETGKAETLPAVEDIPSYPVRVIEGMIEIGLPKKQ